MGERILFFDFDGTIADTKAVYYKAIEHELDRFGFPRERVDSAIDLGLSLKKTLGNLGLNFVSKWMIHNRVAKNVKKYSREIGKCRDVDSIKEIMEEKIIVTNSLKEFAVPILRHLKIKKYFNEIYGADDFSDKAGFISRYLKKNKIKKKDCFYIGDRVADVKLARKVGCVSVIVSGKCSWNSRKELINVGPDYLVSNLSELKKILQRD
ncbi:MAG: HAD family hydrolase [Nanoarchaeota archaeon]|nr:HAD family hydrolase [Nanoarchaeota archaeon]MBU4086992.1 HAD family hydrolase [Nanoarchaeota archaeon]